MDKFYVITNKLKDADYSITNEVLDYIEQHGKTGILFQKDPDGHIMPENRPGRYGVCSCAGRGRNADPRGQGTGGI